MEKFLFDFRVIINLKDESRLNEIKSKTENILLELKALLEKNAES